MLVGAAMPDQWGVDRRDFPGERIRPLPRKFLAGRRRSPRRGSHGQPEPGGGLGAGIGEARGGDWEAGAGPLKGFGISRTGLKWFWKGCKPNSVCVLANGENHLSERPIPETCFAFTKPGADNSSVSYLALHPMGFSVPRCLRFARWSLTPPFHPYRLKQTAAVLFSVALSVGTSFNFPPACISGRTGVTRHHALRCSDFPPPACAGSDSPPFQNQTEDKRSWGSSQARTLSWI